MRARSGFKATLAVAGLVLFSPGSAPQAGAQDADPAVIIADQIRRQGYACETPVSAERDKAQSRPNAVVWHLSCRNAGYRVVLVPDLAAHVERIER